MALYDDKRFILSHIRHSFITGDDTGKCETTMLPEKADRYPYEAIYHHPFDYNSDDDDDDDFENAGSNFQYTKEQIELFKKTEINHESEFAEHSEHSRSQSLDITSDSFEVDIRRRSNTAIRLEKLKKEKMNSALTKTVTWKTPLKVVSESRKGHATRIKRVVLDAENLPEEELKLLEYDEKENVYYETRAYREYLFPKRETQSENHESSPFDELKRSRKDSEESKGRPKSALTLLIEKSSNVPTNPFNEFARFDGRVSDSNANTKRFQIFFKLNKNGSEPCDFTKRLSSQSPDIAFGPNWIEVIILAHARICDLIGLICWHYTRLELEPPLKPDTSAYALKIAEENGDFDNEFPNLNFNDEVKRYGFPCLTMVSVETHIVATVSIVPEGTFSQFLITSQGTTLNFLIDQIKKKRPNLFQNKSGTLSFHLGRRSLPNVSLDLNSRISDYVENNSDGANADFVLVIDEPDDQISKSSENTSRTPEKNLSLPRGLTTGLRLNKSSSALYSMTQSTSPGVPGLKKKTRDPDDISSNIIDIMKAPLYQCFEVNTIHKLYHSPVEMGISETKLEITPKTGRARSPTSHFTDRFLSKLQKIKAMTINLEDVVECLLVPAHKSAPGKQTFKIVYWNGHDFKSIKFESDHATVDDIIFKLEHVMKMRTSVRRKEYNTIKNKKKNISTKIYFKSKSSGSSSSGTEEPAMTSPTISDDGTMIGDVTLRRDSKFLMFRTKHE